MPAFVNSSEACTSDLRAATVDEKKCSHLHHARMYLPRLFPIFSCVCIVREIWLPRSFAL